MAITKAGVEKKLQKLGVKFDPEAKFPVLKALLKKSEAQAKEDAKIKKEKDAAEKKSAGAKGKADSAKDKAKDEVKKAQAVVDKAQAKLDDLEVKDEKAVEKAAEDLKKVRSKENKGFVGKKLGGKTILSVEDVVLSGRDLKAISLSDSTTCKLSLEDLSTQAK